MFTCTVVCSDETKKETISFVESKRLTVGSTTSQTVLRLKFFMKGKKIAFDQEFAIFNPQKNKNLLSFFVKVLLPKKI